MTLASAPAMDSLWLGWVLEPAARALLLAGAVWILFVALRVRAVSLRLATWTVILYAALAMPFLSRVVPEVPIPILSTQTVRQSLGNFDLSKTTANAPVTRLAVYHPDGAGLVAAGGPTGAARRIPWLAIAIAAYLLIVGIFLARFAFGLIAGRRLRRAGAPIRDGWLHALLACESRKAGVERPPQLAESAVLSVPATLGLFRHVILLPVEWTEWSREQTVAVLAHELSHIARRDGLTQALSRLHRAFFWFSPLSWWLDSALVELAEQASDDAALRSGADRIGYAEVLLHFFRALRAARGRVRWEGVSMAQGSRSERRVERILRDSPLSHGLSLVALGAVVLAAVPLIGLAAALHPSRVEVMPTSQAAAPPVPPALALTPVSLPTPGVVPARRVPVDVAQKQGRRNGSACHGDEAFAVVTRGSVIGECASAADLARVWNLRREAFGNFVWFRRGGRSYIVGDPETVRAALSAFAPLATIQEQQAVLVWKENDLLRDQAVLAMQQMTAGFETPEFASQLRQLAARLREIELSAAPGQSARAQAELAQAEWNVMQGAIARLEWVEARNLQAEGRLRDALLARQDALSREQARLARQQAETARQAMELTRRLIGQSLGQGLARSL